MNILWAIIFGLLFSQCLGCHSFCKTCYNEAASNCITCPSGTLTLFENINDFVYDIKIRHKGTKCVILTDQQFAYVSMTMKNDEIYNICFLDSTTIVY